MPLGLDHVSFQATLRVRCVRDAAHGHAAAQVTEAADSFFDHAAKGRPNF